MNVRPTWPGWINTVLSVMGLGVASYLTYEHYTGSRSLTCPATGGIVNCLKVTTSIYSKIHGVPVAVLGLVFFVVMLVLQLPPLWKTDSRYVYWGRLAWCVVGLATAAKLVYDELFQLHAICLWCTSVHIISFLIFVVTAFGMAIYYGEPEPPQEIKEKAKVS